MLEALFSRLTFEWYYCRNSCVGKTWEKMSRESFLGPLSCWASLSTAIPQIWLWHHHLSQWRVRVTIKISIIRQIFLQTSLHPHPLHFQYHYFANQDICVYRITNSQIKQPICLQLIKIYINLPLFPTKPDLHVVDIDL